MTESTEDSQKMLMDLSGNLIDLASRRKAKEDKQGIFETLGIYGDILASCVENPWAFPESILPLSKDKIKNSIKSAILVIDDTKTIKHLQSVLISLAKFIPDKDAEVVNKYHKEMDQLKFNNVEEMIEYFKSKDTKQSEIVENIEGKMHDATAQLLNEFFKLIQENKRDSEIYHGLKEAFQMLEDLRVK